MSSVVLLEDEQIERKILGYEIQDARYFHAFNPEFFSFATTKETQRTLNNFFAKYNVPPTLESIRQYTSDVDVLLCLQDVSAVPMESNNYKVLVDHLFDMYTSRKLLNEAESVLTGLQTNRGGANIIKSAVSSLTGIQHPLIRGEAQRGWGYEHLTKLWEEYKAREAHPERFKNGIPYGITLLDKYTNGGARKGHISLIYGDTSAGKTRLKLNLAYNMAALGYKVMYITIEDPLDAIVRMWIARSAFIDYTSIENADLLPADRRKMKTVLNTLYMEKKLPYVVYWTGTATTADLRREVDLFAAQNGCMPDVLFFDYSNEAYPARPFNNQSERFNYLFSEYRQFTSEYELPFITSMQQSRTGVVQQSRSKKKDDNTSEEAYDLTGIGQSHYVAPHCHVIMFIRQPVHSAGENSLEVYIQKNRYGQRKKKIELFALWPVGFVGDRNRVLRHGGEEYQRMLAAQPVNALEPASYAMSPVNHPASPAEDAEVDDVLGGEAYQ